MKYRTPAIIKSVRKTVFFPEFNDTSIQELLDKLTIEDLPHRILYDTNKEVVEAISFHDPKWFPENASKNQLKLPSQM